MGNTEQEQAEAKKHYIHEVFIPEYTKNFNKELSVADIKFYGANYFCHSSINNELNMHCHLAGKTKLTKRDCHRLLIIRTPKNRIVKSAFAYFF